MYTSQCFKHFRHQLQNTDREANQNPGYAAAGGLCFRETSCFTCSRPTTYTVAWYTKKTRANFVPTTAKPSAHTQAPLWGSCLPRSAPFHALTSATTQTDKMLLYYTRPPGRATPPEPAPFREPQNCIAQGGAPTGMARAWLSFGKKGREMVCMCVQSTHPADTSAELDATTSDAVTAAHAETTLPGTTRTILGAI